MVKIDDITLMAFADGELSETEAQRVAAAIAQDPQMAATVSEHKQLKETINTAFDEVDNHPLPEGITKLLDKAKGSSQTKKSFWGFSFLTSDLPWFLPAYATAAIIVAAFVGIITFAPDTAPHQGLPITVASMLDNTLNNTADDTKTPYIHIEETYQKADGTLCRTFRFDKANVNKQGLACRATANTWSTIAVATFIPEGAYLPAGEETNITISALTSEMALLPAGSEVDFLR